MARFTAGYNREIALYLDTAGAWRLILGKPGGREIPAILDRINAHLVADIVAHTHTSGRVFLSIMDVPLLNKVGVQTHTVISAGGDVVRSFDVPVYGEVPCTFFEF
jgi:hypothetical protein